MRIDVIHSLALAVVLAVALGSTRVVASDESLADPQRNYVSNELLVKFKAGTPSDRALAVRQAVGANELHEHANIGVHLWRLGKGLSVEKALEILANPGHAQFIEYAEPNYLFYASDLAPDPRMTDLYGLYNVGQTGGTVDADIDAPEAWAAESGSGAPVLVGVIDTGIDYTHPDLQGRIDPRGWDFVNNDNDPMDDNGHGTHVAGTIAAVRNNGMGVAGVASNVLLLPLKFLSASGSGSSDNAIAAINYAQSLGAQITSNSWGGGSRSKALQDAIAASSALFVAAAGNSGSSTKAYPAGYDDAKILSVAATDQKDALATFSNYGSAWVDLGAPGVNILSTQPNQTYALLSGTSMATPHVSGAAAVVMAQLGTTVAQTKVALLNSVDVVPSLQGKVLMNGRLNVARAIGLTVPPPGPGSDTTPPGAVVGAVVNASEAASTYHSVQLDWTTSGDDGADAGSGAATAYDVRYLVNAAVTDSNWSTATQALGEPAPRDPGLPQSFVVDNLEGSTTYGFGIQAIDESGNRSPRAFTALATTPAAPWSVANVAPTAYTYRDLDFFSGQPGVGYENGQVRYATPASADWKLQWTNELVDANGGSGVSLRFAPSGAATMSYASALALKFATRSGASWSVATIESNKGTTGVSDYTSLAYDSAGNPAISYRNTKSGGLKFARRSGAVWKTEFVLTSGARYNALAFDRDDNPIIAFSDDLYLTDNQLDSLRVARWDGAKWNITDVEKGVVGYGVFASIAVDDAGHIGVLHNGNNDMRYAYFDGANWSIGDIGPGSYATFAFDANGVPYVAYTKSGQSWVAVGQAATPADSVRWTHELVDTTGGGRTVIRFDGTTPNVLYDARPDGLDLARKNPN